MPFVNVYAKNVVRGLKRPLVGKKTNINLTEEEITLCKAAGAKVELLDDTNAHVHTEEVKPVEVELKVPVVEDVVVEAPVAEPVEEPATEEAPVVEERKQPQQHKNSNKKK